MTEKKVSESKIDRRSIATIFSQRNYQYLSLFIEIYDFRQEKMGPTSKLDDLSENDVSFFFYLSRFLSFGKMNVGPCNDPLFSHFCCRPRARTTTRTRKQDCRGKIMIKSSSLATNSKNEITRTKPIVLIAKAPLPRERSPG